MLTYICFGVTVLQAAYISADDRPFPVDTYIDKNAAEIVEWATGYQDYVEGSSLSNTWKTPDLALGPAVGGSFDVVSLGRGGRITLTFTNPIRNGDGADFCVFENGFNDEFLELAWVEVSTDGEHYVRFPNFSTTLNPSVSYINPSNVFGLASRYRSGRGTGFDLEQLSLAYQAALADETDFSAAYKADLEVNYSYLDLEDIRYVRLVDIVGDGSALDADGYVIYDAYPTTGSAGFDLDAVGVLNRVDPGGLAQAIDFPEIAHQRLSDGRLELLATASSGLAVEYRLLSGSPATLDEGVLTFTGTGAVQVLAIQSGDADYMAAEEVLRDFVVADALQHIYFEPIANQLVGATDVPLSVVSSGGLAVQLEVASGPSDVVILGTYPSFTLNVGDTAGSVTIRAWQAGDSLYAPADDVFIDLEVVPPGAASAPRSFAQWQADYAINGDRLLDTDGDGANDFLEYVAGTDPKNASEHALPTFVADGGGGVLTVQLSRRAPLRMRLLESESLSGWSERVPEVVSSQSFGNGEPIQVLRLRVTQTGAARLFWRFDFESL